MYTHVSQEKIACGLSVDSSFGNDLWG